MSEIRMNDILVTEVESLCLHCQRKVKFHFSKSQYGTLD